jgi:hypothetical protein
VLAAVGAVASLRAPAARASGCHAPDRPVLGLSFAWDAPSGSRRAPHSQSARLTRTPCSDDLPGSSQVPTGLGPPGLATSIPSLPEAPAPPGRATSPEPPLHPLHTAFAPLRPPRAS